MKEPQTTARTTTRLRLVEDSNIVTTVPYWTDGTPSRCWIGLRDNPDLIDLIGELRGRPASAPRSHSATSLAGPLMTIACTAATTRLFQVGGQAAWRTRPSLQLAFADSGTLRPLRRLAGSRAPRRGSVAILKQPAEAGWSSYGRSRR